MWSDIVHNMHVFLAGGIVGFFTGAVTMYLKLKKKLKNPPTVTPTK